jgi:predicted metal-binding protein
MDLGTNGELALSTPAGITTCATAAGPAFEGAEIDCGSPAVAGAIDRVRIAAGLLRVSTIGHAPARSICGSGLIDALAAALGLGLVDETGKLRTRAEVAPHLAGYLAPEGEAPALWLADGVYLSQADIRRLQLAKSAIAAGIAVLLDETGLTADGVDRVELAGGFGTHVRPAALAAIGLIPASWAGRTRAVGNAALAGAVRALFPGPDGQGRQGLERVARACGYLELSSDPRFTDAFVDAIGFPEPAYTSPAELTGLARRLGFDEAALLDLTPTPDGPVLRPAAWVRAACSQNTCQAFGTNWMCPPALTALEVLEAQMAEHKRALLVQTVGQLEDSFDIDGMRAAGQAHQRRFLRLVGQLRPAYPGLRPLGAGACSLCARCTYPDEPCRLPGLAHASMEASGLVVTEVCAKAGVVYHHGPGTVTYTSLVLLD